MLAARLSDAKFFWEQDLKVALDDQAQKLAKITFHEKLGSVADKVERVAKLARWLVEQGIVERADADDAERAARLCKADLVTGMVGEFPELQGIMGGYYTRAQCESDVVADAVRDHYKPVGQGDDVPTAPVTVAVSLADKLDTLAQFFAAGMPPTGSKDPFALRRAAIGFLSLLLRNDLRCSFKDVLVNTGAGSSFALLEEFLIDRLKVQQREAGVRHDLIDAVFSLGGEDDLVRLLARVKALQTYITTAEGANLLSAYKRAANILKGSNPVSPVLDKASDAPMSGAEEQQMPQTGEEDPFVDVDQGMRSAIAGNHGRTEGIIPEGAAAADIALLGALDVAEPQAQKALEDEQFEDAMAALAGLREPIDRFFEEVMVNDADPAKRAFRLGLLARFRDAVHKVADFSKIEG